MVLASAIKRSFVAGLILLTPLVVTVYVLSLLVNWSLTVIDPVVQGTRLARYTANIDVVAQVLAVVLIVGAVVLLGFLAQLQVGRRAFGNIGRVVNIIPLISTIYGGIRQVANSLVERNTAYQDVVIVEYPREDVYTIGFVTGESPPAVEDGAGKELVNVFLPHSPNPTAGRLAMLPSDQVHEIDMSVRRGMRLVVTTGIGGESVESGVPELEAIRSN